MVIACDQRGGMRTILAKTPEEQAKIGNDALGLVKMDITAYLARHAGCVLGTRNASFRYGLSGTTRSFVLNQRA